MSYSNGPRIVTDGLVLCLDASNTKSYSGTGSAWNNLISSNYNATKAGSQSPTYPLYSNGYFTFNGGVTATNYSRFDISNIPSFSALSIFVWFRTSDTTNNKTILRMDNSDFEISINGSSTFLVAAGTNYNDISVSVSNSIITNGSWHNVGLTFDGQSLKGFLNALQVSTNSRGSSTTTAAGTLKIGTRDDAYAQHFFGDMASILLYNRVLSSIDIIQNYNAIKSRFNL